MLKRLALSNVGPAGALELNFGQRLNLITGDNGLGKSFLLDVAWWALTRRWPQEVNRNLTSGYMAKPTDRERAANIDFTLDSKTRSVTYSSRYSPRDEAWIGKGGRPWNPGLVIYAHADGGFSVWDPARNYWLKRGNVDVQERIPAYVFTPQQVWDGLSVEVNGKHTQVCNGLIADWAGWIKENKMNAKRMQTLLNNLASSSNAADRLKAGPLGRLSLNDSREIPTLRTAYGMDVPIVSASSGVKRIVALAYMLMWSWNEHRVAVEDLGEERTNQVTLLIDEIEAHLHPKWQRSILRSVLNIAKVMHAQAVVQVIAATHSPMILASAEPLFDAKKDAWFDLDLIEDPSNSSMSVELNKRDFVRHGDISHWLTSNAFDFKEARSLEAEEAISRATDLIRSKSRDPVAINEVHKELSASLGEIDRFWLRWEQYRQTVQ